MSSGQEVGSIFGVGLAQALLRSPTVIIATIALWGMNVSLFRLFGIDYVHVLLLDLKKEEEEIQKARKRTTETVPLTDDGGEIELSSIPGSLLSEESNATNDSGMTDDSTSSTSNRKPSNYTITETKLLGLAATLILALYATSFVWIQVGRGSTIGAIFFFYILVIFTILLPFPSTAWIRLACGTVLKRAGELLRPRCSCVHGKPRPVPFIDVFFADAMCSMSKVFFDWGMLWLMASHYPFPVPASFESILIPSCFASLPYLIRARQCLIMYNVGWKKKDPKRYQHVLNAIKYSTSLFPLIVSAYAKTESGARIAPQLEYLLIILLIINATYCLIWDIMMDWGMLNNPIAVVGQCVPTSPTGPVGGTTCMDAALRPRLRFGTALTLAIVLLDVVLRYSWTLRFYEALLFPSNDAYILCSEFLEVFRRSVWNLLRVEWENIKQTRNAKKNSSVMHDMPVNNALIGRR